MSVGTRSETVRLGYTFIHPCRTPGARKALIFAIVTIRAASRFPKAGLTPSHADSMNGAGGCWQAQQQYGYQGHEGGRPHMNARGEAWSPAACRTCLASDLLRLASLSCRQPVEQDRNWKRLWNVVRQPQHEEHEGDYGELPSVDDLEVAAAAANAAAADQTFLSQVHHEK